MTGGPGCAAPEVLWQARGGRKGEGAKERVGVLGGQTPVLEVHGVHSQPSLHELGELEVEVGLGGGWGQYTPQGTRVCRGTELEREDRAVL